MSIDTLGFDVLHNFISPVTGRVLATTNYVLVGDSLGIATPSPILIDIRLDLNALKKRYNTLVTADFIVGHPNYEIPDAQVLVDLADGFMYNTAGIVSTTMVIPIGSLPDLLLDNIWIGDATNRPVATQRVKLLNLPSFLSADVLSNLGLKNLYTGKSIGLTSPLEAAEPTTTMRIDMSNTPNLSIGKIWIGVSNPTPPVITIDGTFPYVHVTGSLNWDPRSVLPPPIGGPEYGVANEIGLNPGEIFIGSSDPTKVGQITTTTTLPLTGLPDLTFQSIWRGDATNRPVESTDLTTAETNITTLQSDVTALQADVAAIEADIVVINGEILALQGQVAVIEATLYTPVVGLVSVVAGLEVTVAALGVTVAAHTASIATLFTLSARTLDQIPLAAADVDLNNHKIINLSNPVNAQDAVNLQTLTAAIAGTGTVTSVTGTANQITVVNGTTTPVISLPTNVVISSSLIVGGINLTGSTISTFSNSNLSITPDGTGHVDLTNHRILNLSDPVGVLDAVNLQTLTAAIATTGTVTSVTGTANQITVVNGTTTPVISLPSTVNVTTAINVANLGFSGSTIASISNNDITIAPNGTGNLILNSGNASFSVGVRGTPVYAFDVFGTIRTTRLLGNPDPAVSSGQGQPPTVTLGAAGVVGTGATSSIAGSLIGGRFTLNTGTGALAAGLVATFTLATTMPSGTFSIVWTPASATAGTTSGGGVGLYVTSTSNITFTLTVGGATPLTASTTYIWNYHIIGY